MVNPLISIVLCTYNGERFLSELIQSLLQQTYPNVEILISDDASTDATRTILSAYASTNNIILNFRDKNLGAIKHFELAALQTSGSYVAFCDQDDIWMPTKLEKLYSAIKGYSLVYSDSLLIDDEGKRLNRRLSDIRNMYSGTDERTFILSNSVSGHSMMIKRELLKKAFPIPKNVFHDHWLAINAASSSGIFFLNETLTFYRQHEKNVTQIELNKTPPARSSDKRYIDYKNLVYFVELIAQIEGVNKKWFYNKLLALLKLKEKRKFVWPLFFFLLKHQEILFYLSKKNTLSRLIEIRKLSRGEKFSS